MTTPSSLVNKYDFASNFIDAFKEPGFAKTNLDAHHPF